MCERLYSQVLKRLESLGWSLQEQDYDAVIFAVDKTYEYILSFCNLSKLPDALINTAVDMATGEFLMDKSAVNEIIGYVDGGFVKSVSEGDVSITYGGDYVRDLEMLIDSLIDKKNILYAYRSLKW